MVLLVFSVFVMVAWGLDLIQGNGFSRVRDLHCIVVLCANKQGHFTTPTCRLPLHVSPLVACVFTFAFWLLLLIISPRLPLAVAK